MTLTCIGLRASQVPVEKNLPANAGDARDTGSNPELRRSPAGGNPLQYSSLGNSMDRGAWWVIVQGVAKSQTGLTEHAGTHVYIGLVPQNSFL